MTTTKRTMRHITLDLIRKRSEHNQGLVSNLEEIALHQEELETIGPVLGRASGKTLKILLLQNNIIGRLIPADWRHFKSLEYLNLALNNVEVVEGIEHLEFLNKLDFTLNFIHLDKLKESVACMSELRSLKELFMIGNPCMNMNMDANADAIDNDNGDEEGVDSSTCVLENTKAPKKNENEGWGRTRMYIVAKLPQLEYLDGTHITRSERIGAIRFIAKLEEELEVLAVKCKEQKLSREQEKRREKLVSNDTDTTCTRIGEDEVTEHCPEDRARLGNELAEQKAEKEANEKANQPKFKNEKDHEHEQSETIQCAREKEETCDFKQCNEGRWHFQFDEEKRPGYLNLDITIQKHLSSSLIDVDIHPTYVSVVIKSKVLRLRLPAEVNSEASTAQRSATTGHLLLTMPKCNPHYNGLLSSNETIMSMSASNSSGERSDTMEVTKGMGPKQQKAQEGSKKSLTRPVTLQGLVKESDGGITQEEKKTQQLDMLERSTLRKVGTDNCISSDIQNDSSDDDDELPPPLIWSR